MFWTVKSNAQRPMSNVRSALECADLSALWFGRDLARPMVYRIQLEKSGRQAAQVGSGSVSLQMSDKLQFVAALRQAKAYRTSS